jgi:hypothetical protein
LPHISTSLFRDNIEGFEGLAMRHITHLIHLGLALSAIFALSSFCSAQVINCSSNDMHRHYCNADTRGGVRMVRQHSEAVCRQGYSWGYDRRGIWVDHGCRADFEMEGNRGYGRDRDHDWDHDRDHNQGYHGGYGPGAAIQAVNCSSDDGHRHFCPVNTQGGVRVFKQHSDAPCRQGYSWGYTRQGIWVDRGCRADFQTGLGGR